LGYFKENNFKGGVQVVNTPEEVKNVIPNMVGKTLITKQTGEKGLPCNTLFIVEKLGNFYLDLNIWNYLKNRNFQINFLFWFYRYYICKNIIFICYFVKK